MIRYAFPIALLALVLGLLLMAVGPAGSENPRPLTTYWVEWGTASGGDYRLTGSAWQLDGVAEGGTYRLSEGAQPLLQVSACCCTYLPCVPRRLP